MKDPTERLQPPNYPPETYIESEQKGDVMIRDMWVRGTECIIYMWVFNMDVESYAIKASLSQSGGET